MLGIYNKELKKEKEGLPESSVRSEPWENPGACKALGDLAALTGLEEAEEAASGGLLAKPHMLPECI